VCDQLVLLDHCRNNINCDTVNVDSCLLIWSWLQGIWDACVLQFECSGDLYFFLNGGCVLLDLDYPVSLSYYLMILLSESDYLGSYGSSTAGCGSAGCTNFDSIASPASEYICFMLATATSRS